MREFLEKNVGRGVWQSTHGMRSVAYKLPSSIYSRRSEILTWYKVRLDFTFWHFTLSSESILFLNTDILNNKSTELDKLNVLKKNLVNFLLRQNLFRQIEI